MYAGGVGAGGGAAGGLAPTGVSAMMLLTSSWRRRFRQAGPCQGCAPSRTGGRIGGTLYSFGLHFATEARAHEGGGASARGGAPGLDSFPAPKFGASTLPAELFSSSHDHADCSIPGVLFPGSCRPDCTLSRHSMQASAASAALRERRSPRGERRRYMVDVHLQIC